MKKTEKERDITQKSQLLKKLSRKNRRKKMKTLRKS
jgi:hypothetical protein